MATNKITVGGGGAWTDRGFPGVFPAVWDLYKDYKASEDRRNLAFAQFGANYLHPALAGLGGLMEQGATAAARGLTTLAAGAETARSLPTTPLSTAVASTVQQPYQPPPVGRQVPAAQPPVYGPAQPPATQSPEAPVAGNLPTGGQVDSALNQAPSVPTGGYSPSPELLAATAIQPFSAPPPQATAKMPADSFNSAVAELLKSAQGLGGDKDLMDQRAELLGQRGQAVSEQTPQDLAALSPGQQSSVRNAKAGAIDKQLLGIEAALNSRKVSRETQLSLANTAYQMVRQEETDARSTLDNIIQNYGSAALKTLPPDQLAQLEIKAGYPVGMAAQQATLKELAQARTERISARDQLIDLGLKLAQQGVALPGLDEAIFGLVNEASGTGTSFDGVRPPSPWYAQPTNGSTLTSGDAVTVNGKRRYVTSGFGADHEGVSGEKRHGGIDLRYGEGETVTPVVPGRVILTRSDKDYGNQVVVMGDDGRQYWYSHLSKFTSKAGDQVDVADELGKAGSTGKSTGPHLDLRMRVYKDGKWTFADPTPVLAGNDKYSYPFSSALGGIAGRLFSSLSDATTKEVNTWVDYLAAGGNQSAISDDKMLNKVLAEMKRQGKTMPKEDDKVTKAKLVLVSAARLKIQQFNDLYDRVGPAMSGVAGRLEGKGAEFSAWLGTDPQAKAFQDVRSATIGPLARAISGETGVLNEGDLKRADGLLPRLTDTREETSFKRVIIKQLLDEMEQAATGLPSLASFEEPNG